MSSLRVLVIDGYRSDYDGRRKAKSFMRVVLQALRTVDTRAEFHMAMMGMEELQQFIYDPNANAHSQAQALRNFSSTDLTFVGGESDLPPWHPKAALLLAYLNQCVIAGSHVFGDEVATRMVWHLACVCGRQLQVVEALNMEIEDGSTTKATSFPKAYSGSTSVMVDETTGEAFQFGSGDQQDDYQMHGDNSPGRNRHMPVRVCNVGLRRRAAALGAARGGKEDRKRLQIVKARGTEQHWLIPKIASEEVGPETYDTFEHRAHRVFDLNAKQDPSRAGMDLIEPFHGMSINGFTGPVSKPGPRRPSAKVRGPDRSCHVLANSQHGPELVETGRILGVNWPLSKLEAPLPNLVIQSYVQHYVLEKPDVSAEEPGLGESQRRDLVYKRLDQAKPLLNRFPLHSFEFALALEGQQGAEFGGGCSDVVRQLYREGALPTPHLTADNAFISLKKKPKTKFAREDPFAPAHKPGATPQPQAKGGGGGGGGRKGSDASDTLPKIRSQSTDPYERVVHVKVPKGPPTNYARLSRMAEALDSAGYAAPDPYKTPWETNLELFNESRKKWVSKQAFRVIPCKANPPTKMLKNFVNLEPWGGEPEKVWGSLVKTCKDYPKDEWVGHRGFKFNFSVKTPSESVLTKRREATRSRYLVEGAHHA